MRQFGRLRKQKQARTLSKACGRVGSLESLEGRVLFSTDYLLDGNQLTTITNGVAGAPVTVPDINNVQITGTSSLNHITVQNFAGHVNVNGAGGGDVITVYAGGGGTVSVSDSVPTSADQLIVRAPSSVVANVAVNSSQVTVGTDTVQYDGSVGAISLVGQLFTSGDALTVNGGSSAEQITLSGASIQVGTGQPIYYSTFTGLTVNGGGGDDTFTLNGDTIPTSLVAGSGNVAFNVNTNSVALSITGGSGNDTYTINSNSGPLTINGQGGANTFVVNSSAAGITLNGGSSTNTYTVASNSAALTINGGGTANNVTVQANSGTVAVNGGTGTDSFTVNATSGAVTLHGGSGTTNYVLAGPTIAPVTVVGGSGSGSLTFHGTVLHDVFAVTATTLSAGTGATVSYSHLTSVTVDGVGGDDTFLVSSAGTPTTLLGETGNNTFNVRADTALVTINTGTGRNTVNVGSNVPATAGNVLASVAGGVAVNGNSTDTLNIDDSADAATTAATLSATGMTGIGGGVSYSGIGTLNVKLGSGGNNVNVTGSPASAVTGVALGAGLNTVTVGSLAPALGGVTDNVGGVVNLTGSGADTLVVDDSGNTSSKTGTLAATAVTGLSPGAINYAGFASIGVNLGTAGNAFTIASTKAGTATSVHGGAGADQITLAGNSSVTHISTGGGADVVAIRTTGAAADVTSSGGASIVVGAAAPAAGGTLAGIQYPLTVNGGGTDTLTLDDSGDAAAATGTLSATSLHGFAMGAAGITYGSIGTLNVNLGSGGNHLTVSDTAAATTTNVTSLDGADVILIQHDSGVTNVNTGAGADEVDVQAMAGNTTIDTETGSDVVNVGSTAPASGGTMSGVVGNLTVNGNGGAALNLDDSGNTSPKSGVLTATTLSGVAGGTITYSGIATLNLAMGANGNELEIDSTSTPTNVNTGPDNDSVYILSTGAALNLNLGTGANDVKVGSTAPASGGVLSTIGAALTVTGSGADSMTLDDSGDTADTTSTLSGTQLTGLNPGGIHYAGIGSLQLNLGSGNNTLTVTGTIAGPTAIDAGAGADTVNVQATGGTTSVTASGNGSVVNVGSLAPSSGGTLDGIAGELSVWESWGGQLSFDDSGSAANKTATISGWQITGLSPAVIQFGGILFLNFHLGSGNDNVTFTTTVGGTTTTVTTGNGANTINLQSTDYATVLNLGTGGNTVNVGSNAPAGNSVMDQIMGGTLTIHGGGADQVNLDDSGNATGKSVTIAGGSVTGLSPSAVDFDNISVLRVRLGSGNDMVGIADSSAYLTVNTGGGNDQVNVQKTTRDITVQTGSGADTVNIGSTAPTPGGTLALIAGMVSVSGNGSDTVNLDDSGDSTGRTGLLTGDTLSGLSPAAIKYSTVAQLAIRLGGGGDVINVQGTAAGTATSISTGAGSNQTNVGSTAPAAGGSVDGIQGVLTVSGPGNDALNVDDSGATGARAGTLDAAQLVIAGANINYSGIGTLQIGLTPTATFRVHTTAATVDTQIRTAGGSVTVGGPAGSSITSGVAGPVTVVGGGTASLTIDDTADLTGRAATLAGGSVTGLSPAAISFSGLSNLAVLLGSGADHALVNGTIGGATTVNAGSGADEVDVRAISGATTIVTGSGTDSVTVGSLAPAAGGVMANIGAALTVTGGGSATLTLDDSGDSQSRSVGITATAVTGLNPGGVSYSGVNAVNVNLGSAADRVNVTGTASATTTSVNGGAGDDSFTITQASGGSLAGPLVVDGGDGKDALVVDDTADQGSGAVTLTPGTIDGIGGPISYSSFNSLQLSLGAQRGLSINDTNPATVTQVSVPSGQGNLSFSGDFQGELTITDLRSGSISVGRNLAGTLSIGGDLASATVGGSLTGTLNVGGRLGALAIGGSDSGSIAAGSVGLITVGAGVANSGNGGVFSVTQNGVLRTLRAVNYDGTGAAGATFKVVYDGSSAAVPQAAVRVMTAGSSRFDLVLEAPANSAGFDLARVDSAVGATNVRNVAVDGNLFNTLTSVEAAAFAEAVGGPAGVYLPQDKLAAVGVTGDLALWSIRAQSIQAVAFASITQKDGSVWSAAKVTASKQWKPDILWATLAQDPNKHQPLVKIMPPTETLRVFCGTTSTVAMYIGMGQDVFCGRPVGFIDQMITSDPPAEALVTYAKQWRAGLPDITNLTFLGDGGSVDTVHLIDNITSTGPLGDITPRGGKAEVLYSVSAPSISGKIRLLNGARMGTPAAGKPRKTPKPPKHPKKHK